MNNQQKFYMENLRALSAACDLTVTREDTTPHERREIMKALEWTSFVVVTRDWVDKIWLGLVMEEMNVN